MDGFGKIAVGLRLTRPYPAFVHSLIMLLTSGLRPGDRYLLPSVDVPYACACNMLVRQFLKGSCDSLLFMDDDHIFSADTLERLRKTPDCEIAFPLVCVRRGAMLPMVLKDSEPGSELPVTTIANPSGVQSVDYVGLGFTLVKRETIEAVVKLLGTEDIFSFERNLGEDGGFCRDARLTGARIAVNSDIIVGHLLTMAIAWDSAEMALNISSVDVGRKPAVSVSVKTVETPKQEN